MRVLVVGMPKSGTTLVYARLAAARGLDPDRPGPTAFFEPQPKTNWPEGSTAKALLVDPVGGVGSRVAEPFSGWNGEQTLEQGRRFDLPILLLRDPRDRWLSAFFYRWLYVHRPEPADFRRALRLTQHKELFPSDLSFSDLACPRGMAKEQWVQDLARRVDRLRQLEAEARQNGWAVVRYEDFRRGDFSALEGRIPADWNLTPTGSQSANFSHIKRTQGAENWRRWWLPQDEALLRPVWQEALEAWGYEQGGPWEFSPSPVLLPSEGSRYMAGLYHHENGPHATGKQQWDKLKRKIKGVFR